jgi:predicted Zn finger-like uncharacterized protein
MSTETYPLSTCFLHTQLRPSKIYCFCAKIHGYSSTKSDFKCGYRPDIHTNHCNNIYFILESKERIHRTTVRCTRCNATYNLYHELNTYSARETGLPKIVI